MQLIPTQGMPLRRSLWLPILAMGGVAIALVLVTAHIYRDLTIENRRQAIQQVIQIKSGELLEKLADDSRSLASEIQRKPDFRDAVDQADQAVVAGHLEEQFHRYFNTAGVIRLRKLYVLDRNYRLLAESSQQLGGGGLGKVCVAMLDQARHRSGAHHLKTISGLCAANSTALFATLSPIGSLQLHGFIMVVTEPSQNLAAIGRELGMPVKIVPSTGAALFQSPNWPAASNQTEVIIAEYPLKADTGETVLTVALANDIHVLERELLRARNGVLTVAGIATALVALLTLFGLQRSLLNPLQRLLQKMQGLERDRKHLGEQVAVTGNREIRSLAEAFNQMTTELGSLYGKLEEMAFRDSLTGLPNRSLLNEHMGQMINQCNRENARFALLIMDLDRFKQINDSLGHPVGDSVLQQVAARLNEILRQGDVFSRLGGDEFAALLPITDGIDDTLPLVKRLLSAMGKPIVVEQNALHVGISIGIAIYPDDGAQREDLMRHADVAMYHAKHNQRGFSFYDHTLDKNSLALLTLEAELLQALTEETLQVYFQPKIAVATGEICGAEALLRWHHPQRGWVGPDEFIPIAEDTGLIAPLTYWVLDRSLAHCGDWLREGRLINLAVNLSARCLHDEALPLEVRKLLDKHAVAPEHLTLEITENVIMHDAKRAHSILVQLDAMGISISVDDFGTGHSSLAYLKRLPVDEIKIDKSFVLEVMNNPSDATIVRATVELGHNLGLRVVAEGVETEEIFNYLKQLNCDVSQGYFHGRPMTPEQFSEILGPVQA
ncbi:MAG: EAL domain-containing protein [Burkholderiales bacterium]|nr:EAL domain-containing protein [Burkholderiales bacterium]